MKKYIISIFGALVVAGCSLEPAFYSSVTPDLYFDSPTSIYSAFSRPFAHWREFQTYDRWQLQEFTTDEICCPQRYQHYEDGGMWAVLHHHKWTPDHECIIKTWNSLGQGIAFAYNMAEDLKEVDYVKCGLDDETKALHQAQLKALAAYFYLRGLDYFGGMPIYKEYTLQEVPRATAKETFDFIEDVLLETIPQLRQYVKGTSHEGFITQGAAAVMLAQLYFNAIAYTGEDRFADCAKVCQDIIDQKYGQYELSKTWNGPFTFDNDLCEENIWVAPSANSQYLFSWYYSQSSPYNIHEYYDIIKSSQYNGICLQPSLQPDGSSYGFKLGRPYEKFHDDDLRKTLYVYNGKKQYQGMFLVGRLENPRTGNTCKGEWDYRGEVLELVDMIAPFKQLGKQYADVSQLPSDIYSAEENSGVRVVKYPTPNKTDESCQWDPDWVVFRLAEVYYMLAECRFRAGEAGAAAELFNKVRARNFSSADPDPVTEDNIDKYRILDEWMTEFIGEGRRRTDLIRWDVFTTERWWDHQPDGSDHLKVFPIPTTAISSSNIIKQNPEY